MTFTQGIRGRIFRSLGADLLGQFLNAGNRLLLVPLFILNWGAESYGEWLILTALAGWFGLGDLGGQLYFVNRLTSEWALNKISEFQKVLSTGLVLLFGISSLLFVLVLVLLYFAPISKWLGLHSIDASTSRTILLFIALRFLISLPLGLYFGVYRAIGTQATSVMYGNLISMFQFLTSAIALMAGYGMVVLALLEVIPCVLAYIIVLLDLRRRLPNEVKLISFRAFKKSIVIEAISPSLHFFSLQFSSAILMQGIILVMAKTLGPIEVAIFNSMRIVSNVMARFMGLLTHSAWPELTRLFSLGENEKIIRLTSIVLSLSLFTGLSYLYLIANFGESLFKWWLVGGLPYSFWVMYLLGCLVATTSLYTWGSSLLMAINRHNQFSRWQLIINLITICLCYYGSAKFGLTGGVVGLLIGQTVPMFAVIFLSLRGSGLNLVANELLIVLLINTALMPIILNVWLGLLSLIFCGLRFLRRLHRSNLVHIY